jgi:hypothetical protein
VADLRTLDPASRLRLAREQKGLSHRQVAEATKLSVRAIELLEKRCRAARRDLSPIDHKSVAQVGLNPGSTAQRIFVDAWHHRFSPAS